MKSIIVISGVSEGKTRFDQIAKETYHIWNINPYNFLGVIARQLGWSGKRDENYYEFIEGLDGLGNKHFGFKYKYVSNMIQKFLSDSKAQLLVTHGCGKNISRRLQDEFEAFTLHILAQPDDTVTGYDHVIVVDENYEENVKRTLRILTKENIENSGEE